MVERLRHEHSYEAVVERIARRFRSGALTVRSRPVMPHFKSNFRPVLDKTERLVYYKHDLREKELS